MDNPRGSQWSNNSCAFDAVLSVLYNIWLDNTQERTVQLKDINNLYIITEGLTKLLTNIFVSICQPFTRPKKKTDTHKFFLAD